MYFRRSLELAMHFPENRISFPMHVTSQEVRKLVLLFVLLVFTFSYFIQGGGYNQNAIIGEIREFVEHGRFHIDSWRSVTGDVSFYKGHFFSNKSPSVFFFAAPLYSVFYSVAHWVGWNTYSVPYQFLATQFITFWAASFWGALCGPVIYILLRRLFHQLKKQQCLALSVVFTLGTLIFPYSTVAFAHAFEVFWVLTCFAAWLSFLDQPSVRSVSLLGIAFGMVLLANPLMVLCGPLLVLGVYGVSRKITFILRLGIMAGLVLIPLFLYNRINFDSFLSGNRNHLYGFTDPKLFMGVFDWPDWSRLWKIFVYSNRSIAPGQSFLLLGIPGAILILHKKILRNYESGFLFSVLILNIVFLLCFNGWHGGSCYGLRYAIPGMLALAFLSVPVFQRIPRIYFILAVLSCVLLFVVTSIEILWSEATQFPTREALRRFRAGELEWSGFPSFPGAGASAGFFRFNWGNLMQLYGLRSVLPLICFQAFFVALIFGCNPLPGRIFSRLSEARSCLPDQTSEAP